MSSPSLPFTGGTNAEPQILMASLSDLPAERRLEKACFPREDVWPWVESLWVLIKHGMVRLKMVNSGEMIGFLSGYQQAQGKVGWISSYRNRASLAGKGLWGALAGSR